MNDKNSIEAVALAALGIDGEIHNGSPVVVFGEERMSFLYNPYTEHSMNVLAECAAAWGERKGLIGNELYDHAKADVQYAFSEIAAIKDPLDVAVYQMFMPASFARYCLVVRENVIDPESVALWAFAGAASWNVYYFTSHIVVIPPGKPDILSVVIRPRHTTSADTADPEALALAALGVENEITDGRAFKLFYEERFAPIHNRDGGGMDYAWPAIHDALVWLSAAIGSGVVGNAVYDAAKTAVRTQLDRIRRRRSAADCIMSLDEARAFALYALVVRRYGPFPGLRATSASLHFGIWQIDYTYKHNRYRAIVPPGAPAIEKIEILQLGPDVDG